MAKYNHNIEDWWRHLGTYDREQVSGLSPQNYKQKPYFTIGLFLSATDIWWNGLTDEEKAKIYEDFFDES